MANDPDKELQFKYGFGNDEQFPPKKIKPLGNQPDPFSGPIPFSFGLPPFSSLISPDTNGGKGGIPLILNPQLLEQFKANLNVGAQSSDETDYVDQDEALATGPAEEAPLVYPLPEGVHYAGAVSVKQLVGETPLPKQEGLHLGESTIHYFAINLGDGTTEYIGFVDYDLRGLRLNRLLFAIAPNKVFGLDTNDIIMDWTDIDSDPARLRRHQSMGEGWNIFMRERDFLLERIREGRNGATAPKRGIVPVVRWKVDAQGHREWVFDHLHGEPYDTIKQAYLAGAAARTERDNPQWLNPLVGLYAVAHFSPEITATWPKQRGYTDSATGSSNAMGPTQVVALATIKRDDFLGSAFITNSEAFIRESVR